MGIGAQQNAEKAHVAHDKYDENLHRERRDELRALRAGAAPDETVEVVGVEVENNGKGLLEMEGSGLWTTQRKSTR